MANAVIFDLNGALAITGAARTEVPRVRLLEAARIRLQRLALSDPANAAWQHDLFVSYVKMVQVDEKTGQGDAKAWWRKAYAQILGMKQRGIMLPTDEQYLEALRQKAGAET